MNVSCGECGEACLSILRCSTGLAIWQMRGRTKLVLHSRDAAMALKYAPSSTDACNFDTPDVVTESDTGL
jgi:hypothetical protein